MNAPLKSGDENCRVKENGSVRLGILTSHPIQYQAPLFRYLASRVNLDVYFAHQTRPKDQVEAGFSKPFEWDVDLLGGYNHISLKNIAPWPSPNYFWGCITPQLLNYFKNRRYDAFIVMGWHLMAYWQGVFACRKYGVPLFVRGDSQLVTRRSFIKKFLQKLFYPEFMKLFDGYFYVGKRNYEYLCHFGAAPEKMIFTPHCIDNQWFNAKAQLSLAEKSLLRKEIGVREGEKMLLFVGKLIPKKRPEDLIRGISLLRGKGIRVCGVFVGSGPLEYKLREITKRLGVHAEFLGFKNQTQLPRYYAAADLLVIPSDGRETWGLVANEAMACGLPVVVSDAVGCGPDLILEGRTGSIYAAGDIAALSESINIMLHKDTFSSQETIRQKIKDYSIEAAADAILSAVRRMRNNRNIP